MTQNYKKSAALLLAFLLLTAPAYPAALRPRAASDRLDSASPNIVPLSEVREILKEALNLSPQRVRELTMRLVWYEPAVTHGFADFTRPHLKRRQSLIGLIARIEGVDVEEVYNRGFLCEMVYQVLNNTLSPSDVNAMMYNLRDRLQNETPGFLNEFRNANIQYTEDVFGKSPERLLLEDVVAQYYAEKARYRGAIPPSFSRVSRAIEDTMRAVDLPSLWPRRLISRLSPSMQERLPANLHELFDAASEYKVDPLPEVHVENALELKCCQLTAVLEAQGISTGVDNVGDMDRQVARAHTLLETIRAQKAAAPAPAVTEKGFKPHPVLRGVMVEAVPDEVRQDWTLDDVARICDTRGIRFVKVYAATEDGRIISYSVAPATGEELRRLLSRGTAVDGSSLDPSLLKLVKEQEGTLSYIPDITKSDVRGLPDPRTFCVHRQRGGGAALEASIKVKLYTPDAEALRRPMRVHYAAKKNLSGPAAVIDFDPTDEENLTGKYETAVAELEKELREHGINELTFLYSDMGNEPQEISITAENPEALIRRLAQMRFFERGVPFTGNVRQQYRGEQYLPHDKAYTLTAKLPTFRIVEFGDTRLAVIVGQLQQADLPLSAHRTWRTAVGAPRNFLKEISGYPAEDVFASPEIEFYLSPISQVDMPVIGYHRNFDGTPYEDVIKDMIAALQNIGEDVHYIHAEVGSTQRCAQFEFVLGHGLAFKTITTKELHKWVLKKVAARHGFNIDFRPKPFEGYAGNGMHVHMSLTGRDPATGERINLFYNRENPGELSRTGRAFVAGIMKYMPEIAALTNQSDNSYRRLVPGYEAPVYIAEGPENRTAMIRIPAFIDPAVDARIELRTPDSYGNLYLTLAAIIAAGKKGIEEGLDTDQLGPDGNPLCPRVDLGENLYYMTATEKTRRGIKQLPSSYTQALYNLYHSTFVRGAFPAPIVDFLCKEFERRSEEIAGQLSRNGINFSPGVDRRSIFISEDIAGTGSINEGTAVLGNGVYINGDPHKISVGRYVNIGKGVRIFNEGSLVKGTKGFMSGTITIADNVDIGEGAEIIARDDGRVTIEANLKIPPGTKLIANIGEHVVAKRDQDGQAVIEKHTHSGVETVTLSNLQLIESAI